MFHVGYRWLLYYYRKPLTHTDIFLTFSGEYDAANAAPATSCQQPHWPIPRQHHGAPRRPLGPLGFWTQHDSTGLLSRLNPYTETTRLDQTLPAVVHMHLPGQHAMPFTEHFTSLQTGGKIPLIRDVIAELCWFFDVMWMLYISISQHHSCPDWSMVIRFFLPLPDWASNAQKSSCQQRIRETGLW